MASAAAVEATYADTTTAMNHSTTTAADVRSRADGRSAGRVLDRDRRSAEAARSLSASVGIATRRRSAGVGVAARRHSMFGHRGWARHLISVAASAGTGDGVRSPLAGNGDAVDPGHDRSVGEVGAPRGRSRDGSGAADESAGRSVGRARSVSLADRADRKMRARDGYRAMGYVSGRMRRCPVCRVTIKVR